MSTGLRWAPDETTATDARCVYDAAPGDGTGFLVVTVEPLPDGGTETVAAVCEDGTTAPAGSTGFVCPIPEGGVFGAAARAGDLVTVAAARVPTGTTADRLLPALAAQLDRVS